ncbi:MAG: carbon monoxide dehydrogenase subunit G [Nocardioides sp.]
MKITGTATLDAPLERVWEAINDPAVLARCIPGCEALTTLAEDHYAMTVTVGVAAIRGTYDGKVLIGDKVAPGALTMKASGAGAAGTIDADVKVALAPSPTGGTDISYDADATVGGAVGGVGQRMLGSVTKKLAGQFFTALDRDIAGVRPGAMAAGSVAAGSVAAEAAAGGVGTSYAGSVPAASAGSLDGRSLAVGVAAGGVVGLVGVVIGWLLGRRSGRG